MDYKNNRIGSAEGRLDQAYIQIGRLFANLPEKTGEQWPPEFIAELIDTINSDVLTRNFGSGVFNKYGSSSKSPFEGGEKERKLVEHFRGYANRIMFRWPITASVLYRLAYGYLEDTKLEDERARRDSLEY